MFNSISPEIIESLTKHLNVHKHDVVIQNLNNGKYGLALRQACGLKLYPLILTLLEHQQELSIALNEKSNNGNTALDWLEQQATQPLSQEHKNVQLQLCAHGAVSGKRFDKEIALQLGIDQFAITSPQDDYPVIGSFGAGQCIILAVHNAETKQAFLMHIMSIHNDNAQKVKRLDDILGSLASQNTVAYITGGYNNNVVSKTTHTHLTALLQKHNIEIKLHDVFHASTAEPKSFALDARTGFWYSPVNAMHFKSETYAVHFQKSPFGEFLQINANKDTSNGHDVSYDDLEASLNTDDTKENEPGYYCTIS